MIAPRKGLSYDHTNTGDAQAYRVSWEGFIKESGLEVAKRGQIWSA